MKMGLCKNGNFAEVKSKTNSPVNRAAKQLAEIKLQRFDLAIDAIFSKSGISRVTNQPALDEFINKRFVHDIMAVILDAPDEIESGEVKGE